MSDTKRLELIAKLMHLPEPTSKEDLETIRGRVADLPTPYKVVPMPPSKMAIPRIVRFE
jgi:hypothetical protein